MKKLFLGTLLVVIPVVAPAQERPFGTLREQAAMQQQWLRKRLDMFLPALMRTHGIDMWVVPMREYNEDARDPVDVVLDRAGGDDAGAGVGRTGGADGAGGGHDHRRRRQEPLGQAAAAQSVSRSRRALNRARSRAC
jgi:hypothetical protein